MVKSLFNKTFTGSDEKELVELIVAQLRNWDEQLKSFRSKSQTGQFPGKQEIEQGLVLVAGVLEQTTSFNVIQRLIDDSKALEDLAEDYDDLDDFYNSQFQTWQALAKALNEKFKANTPALTKNDKAKKALNELQRIYNLPTPYEQLRHIQPLIEEVSSINKQLVEEKRQHAFEQVNNRIQRVEKTLNDVSAPDDLKNKALIELQKCKQHMAETHSIPQIMSDQQDAGEYEDNADRLINDYIESKNKEVAEKPATVATNPGVKEAITPVYVKKTISFNPASVSNGESIETEEHVEHYVNKVRDELLKAIKAGNKVRIQ